MSNKGEKAPSIYLLSKNVIVMLNKENGLVLSKSLEGSVRIKRL